MHLREVSAKNGGEDDQIKFYEILKELIKMLFVVTERIKM